METMEEKYCSELESLCNNLDSICSYGNVLYVVDKSSTLSRIKINRRGNPQLDLNVKVIDILKTVNQIYEAFKRSSIITTPREDWNNTKLSAAGGYLVVPDDHNDCMILFEGHTPYHIQCVKTNMETKLTGIKMWPSNYIGATLVSAIYDRRVLALQSWLD